MEQGDWVRVYPHGKPELAAKALVAIISRNQRSIALGFPDRPPFGIDPSGMTVHPEHGLMLIAYRETLGGVPWGPWIEMFGGGHFEIEG